MSETKSPQDGSAHSTAESTHKSGWLSPVLILIFITLFLYLGTYVGVRSYYAHEYRTLLVGPSNVETAFDSENSIQKCLYYMYLPLGYLDECMYERQYSLKKPLLDSLFE